MKRERCFLLNCLVFHHKQHHQVLNYKAVSIGEAWGQQPPGFCWKVKTVRCLEPSSASQQIHQDSKKETNKWSLILSAMMKKKLCVVCYFSFGRGGWKGCIIFSFEFCEFELD